MNQRPDQHDRDARLRRLKRTALGATAALAIGLWSVVAGDVGTMTEATTTPADTTQDTTHEDDSFFGAPAAAPGLGQTGDVPVLRSGGS